MKIVTIPVSTFGRFVEASPSQKVKVVRDSRLYQSDPQGYAARDFYRDFRNTLKQTHWQTNDISRFEAALPSLISRQGIAGKRDHFQKLGEAYIAFWKKHDGANCFDLKPEVVSMADLDIRGVAELGLREHGDALAVKLSLPAPRPTRLFRQVIQYVNGQALVRNSHLQPVIFDVRRETILQPAPIPREFQLALEGEAMAFRQIWEGLDRAAGTADEA